MSENQADNSFKGKYLIIQVLLRRSDSQGAALTGAPGLGCIVQAFHHTAMIGMK